MVYLIRHPQSEANVLGISGNLVGKLTKRGEWQARKTAKRCATLEVANILTSPALRCTYLATEINQYHNVPITIVPDLRERDYGNLEGQHGTRIFELGISNKPENGESAIDVYTRARRFYQTTTLDNQTLIISHGLFLKMLTAQILGLDAQYALETLKFSNCAISDVQSGRIEFLNDRNHLGIPISRIHIFGGYATGKTTLANQLSELFQIQSYHLDEIKYSEGLVKERSVAERIGMLDRITEGKKWITEGAWTSYASNAFNRADFLIYCDIAREKAIENAIRRQNSRENTPGASLEKLLHEIDNYYYTNQEVSKVTHDAMYYEHRLRSTKSTQIQLNQLEFPEDLWGINTHNIS